MTKTYIFRASLETAFYVESVKGRMQRLSIPKRLPIEFGPFHLDRSPNSEFYFAQLGSGELPPGVESVDGPPPNQDYPNSVLYVETSIEVEDREDPEAPADEIFEDLESMLRSFQIGNVSLRRNLSVGTDFGSGDLVWVAFVFSRPIKPKPEPLYHGRPYLMDDDVLYQFKQYFSRYWETVRHKPKRIYNALRRFSSSYEERVSSDRLVELIIALESLFGGKGDSTTYKVALRASCFLHPPGKDRQEAFEKIGKAYDDRSRLIHGEKLHPRYTDGEIDAIEDLLRKAINKFLEYDVTGTRISSDKDLDNLLFFRNQ